VAEKLYAGVVSVVVRGPTICGAVGGDRSAFSADEALPAVRRRSPAPPASLAATFKVRERNRLFGRNSRAQFRKIWCERKTISFTLRCTL
jgi:hypothetical protein